METIDLLLSLNVVEFVLLSRYYTFMFQNHTEPEALEGCFYKNMTLQRGEIYQDGCNATCSCGEAGKVNCKAR